VLCTLSEYATALADNAYFRQHAIFPGVNSTLNGPETPWIMYGGSLAGAQTAFTLKIYNHLFAGGIGSSATTYSTLEYPQWYNPIMKFGPSDCVSRIIDIVDKIDSIINSNNEEAIKELKDVFGLKALKNIGDFAQTISYPSKVLPNLSEQWLMDVELVDRCSIPQTPGKSLTGTQIATPETFSTFARMSLTQPPMQPSLQPTCGFPNTPTANLGLA
jgi:hypothetical protein